MLISTDALIEWCSSGSNGSDMFRVRLGWRVKHLPVKAIRGVKEALLFMCHIFALFISFRLNRYIKIVMSKTSCAPWRGLTLMHQGLIFWFLDISFEKLWLWMLTVIRDWIYYRTPFCCTCTKVGLKMPICSSWVCCLSCGKIILKTILF